MNQVHRAFCAKAPRDRGCVKNASNKENFKTKDTCPFFKNGIKAKISSRSPAPGSDFAVSEQTLERFTATVCVYLVWHCVEEYAVNISDSSSWLKDETLSRPSDEEFVEAWCAIITATNGDITTATTTEDNTTATTEDVTTTTTHDVTEPTATAATLPVPAATTMLPATTNDSLPAPCSSCLVDEAAAAAGPANTLPVTNTTTTAVAVDSKPAPVAAVLAAPTVFLYVEAGSSRCSSSDGAADSPGHPCMLQHDQADIVAAEDHGSHTLAAAAAAAKGKLPLLLQQLPAECDTAAALAGLADSANSFQQHAVRLHSLHAAATATAAAAKVVVGGGGTQGSKASAGWLRRACSRLFACGSSSSLGRVSGV